MLFALTWVDSAQRTQLSSDDDEHNTSNSLLLQCAHALFAPVLLSSLSEADELVVALWCRFALDVFTIVQQDFPIADQGAMLSDLELVEFG